MFGNNCSLTYYRLGVPKPAGTPSVSSASENAIGRSSHRPTGMRSWMTISLLEAAGKSYDGRSDSGVHDRQVFALTIVNSFGEESAPGNPSRVISVCDGDTVD